MKAIDLVLDNRTMPEAKIRARWGHASRDGSCCFCLGPRGEVIVMNSGNPGGGLEARICATCLETVCEVFVRGSHAAAPRKGKT